MYQIRMFWLNVRWYLKYSLSYRDLEEMMLERGIDVSFTTIMRWTHQYSPIIEERMPICTGQLILQVKL